MRSSANIWNHTIGKALTILPEGIIQPRVVLISRIAAVCLVRIIHSAHEISALTAEKIGAIPNCISGLFALASKCTTTQDFQAAEINQLRREPKLKFRANNI